MHSEWTRMRSVVLGDDFAVFVKVADAALQGQVRFEHVGAFVADELELAVVGGQRTVWMRDVLLARGGIDEFATEVILRLCSRQYCRLGTRAMEPSSLMISQMTAGFRPARRIRSTASVWPARTRTPPGTQREDVARTGEVGGFGVVVDGDTDGMGAVGGTDACGDSFAGVDADGEGGAEAGGVFGGLRMQGEAVAFFCGERQTDEAAAVPGHKVDGFGGDQLGGSDQIAFVFAIFVVDEHDHAALAEVFEHLGYLTEFMHAF